MDRGGHGRRLTEDLGKPESCFAGGWPTLFGFDLSFRNEMLGGPSLAFSRPGHPACHPPRNMRGWCVQVGERPMKTLILTSFAFVTCCMLSAQDSVPSVVFSGNCANEIPSYPEWFQQTPLLHGQAYLAQGKRQEQIQQQYSKLKLQMSSGEAQELLGKPDFSKPLPAARLANAPVPSPPACSSQVAYIFRKNSENIADMADVAIYLFFSEDDKLYWASPQNLPNLKPLGSATEGSSRQPQTVSWREYVFANDGFALTLPESPVTNSDARLPEMTVYSVSVPPDSKLSLRVSHETRDCVATLTQLRGRALEGKSGADPTSVKEVSLHGSPGLEYQYKDRADRTSSDRF
jgi:hypothetical protein